jgi:protein disulfide-isomerase
MPNLHLCLPISLDKFTLLAAVGFLLLVGFAGLANATEPKTTDTTWLVDAKVAVQQSHSTKKPIMLLFTGSDWCIYCKKFESEITSSPEFQTWSEKFIKVEIDFPQHKTLPPTLAAQNALLKRKFSDLVLRYPTVLIVDSKGSVLAKAGYSPGGGSNWVRELNSIVK